MPAILLLLTGTMTTLVAYFGLTEGIVQALIWLLVFDFMTGVFAVIRIDKSSFRSAIGRSKLVDKMMALLFPMGISVLGKGAGLDVSSVVNVLYVIIMFFEVLSMMGNIVSAKRRKRVGEIDATEILYKYSIAYLKGFLKGKFSMDLDLEDKKKDDK